MSETRKLAAILVADVVGYSRLAGADEDRTLARLRTLRSDLIEPTISVHRGRVVKRTGDGSIIEFRSVVDAVGFVTMPCGERKVSAAQEIVRPLRLPSATCPSPRREACGAFGLR
jgi:class 3 adenylate cyclase